ncbi:AraC family transcriptional regulator [Phyllobacterium sp. SB3]|uniref:helix-turn-helix transcriptional regulator n=1 Tax=Phyllobacterium sp. SB3 TaxID=3156073 RepID=UPI0032AF4AD0
MMDEALPTEAVSIKNAVFDILLKGSRVIGPQTDNLWTGIGVERRSVDAIEREEEEIDYHYILLWGNRPTIAERAYKTGRFKRVVKPPHTLSLGCAGRLPAVRALTSYEVTACVINTKAAQNLVEEMECKDSFPLHEHLGVEDQPLAHLITLAALEVENGGASGKLYRDSIEQALISRFLAVARAEVKHSPDVSALPKHALKRILDRLQSEFDRNFTLSDLAHDCGYSRSHFLKMFQMATGKTPFEYLRDVRLEEARRALVESDETIVSIALRVGFSSHSHLSRLFSQKYGLAPSSYRRR